MGLTDDLTIPEKPQTEALLFLLVENSWKLNNNELDMVNKAMETLMPELSRWKKYDIVVKAAALVFSSEAHWITAKGPVEAEQLSWKKLISEGACNFGAACNKLYEKLSNTPLIEKLCGKCTPVIIALSSGYPDDDWEKPLSLLWDNNYFKNAWKLGFLIGENTDTTPLVRFTGTSEAVERITESDCCKRNPETGDYYAITARISGLIEKRYFIDDWFPGQWEGLQRDYGVADWKFGD